MENLKDRELSDWVQQCMASAAPPLDWEPDAGMALANFQMRLTPLPATRRYWVAGAVAASLTCIGLLSVPGTRGLAQQLWQRITVGRIDVVRVDFGDLPDEAKSLQAQALNKPAPPQVVRSSEEASQQAGFAPRFPRPGILSGTPRLSVLGPLSFGTAIKAADLELALRKARVADQPVPKEWDGAHLGFQIGATITADWNNVTLMQGLPPVLSMPPGFDLNAFTIAVLRAAGMRREAAQRFGRQMITAPALLFGIGAEDQVNIREVHLHTGPATLIEDFGDNGEVERITLLWAVPDRVYILSGGISRDLAIALANAIG